MSSQTPLQETFSILEKDLAFAREQWQKSDTPYTRRTLVRTSTALMEGLVNQMGDFILETIDCGVEFLFTSAELSILKEETYSLNKKGEVDSRVNFQPFLPKLLHTAHCYMRLFGEDFNANTGVYGWECMQSLVKTRNRLMHPKGACDLEVSDKNFEMAQNAVEWFNDEFTDIFEKTKKRYNKMLKVMDAADSGAH